MAIKFIKGGILNAKQLNELSTSGSGDSSQDIKFIHAKYNSEKKGNYIVEDITVSDLGNLKEGNGYLIFYNKAFRVSYNDSSKRKYVCSTQGYVTDVGGHIVVKYETATIDTTTFKVEFGQTYYTTPRTEVVEG